MKGERKKWSALELLQKMYIVLARVLVDPLAIAIF